MSEYELEKEHGWSRCGEYWLWPTDTGLLHQRAHTTDEAIHRTTKAVLKQRRIGDVWILPPRTIEDGIAMGFIHKPRKENA